MSIRKMTDLDLNGKRVLIRQDLNAPFKDGVVTNDKRLRAGLPTVQAALAAGGRVLVMSHLGRPVEGEFDEQFSLAPIATRLSELLGIPVRLERDWLDRTIDVGAGEVVLLENCRFCKGEKANDEELGKKMAALCEVYVFDAFGTAHRAQASTNAAGRFAPVACAGLLMSAELEALSRGLAAPARPLVGIVGGSKVSTKLTVLDTLSTKVDKLIVGGGMANNFIAAQGHSVGKSLYEPDMLEEARSLMKKIDIPVPVDVVVGKELSETAEAAIKDVTDVADDDMILDVGPKTRELYAQVLSGAGTVVWNGPVGVFEIDQFGEGTKALGQAVVSSGAFSIVGGGDTVAAVEKYNLQDKISYISTGGGSFLEYLEGKELPAVKLLEERGAE